MLGVNEVNDKDFSEANEVSRTFVLPLGCAKGTATATAPAPAEVTA